MKKLIVAISLVFFYTMIFSQHTTTIPSINKQEYLKKSKTQKRAAWILLGTGSLAVILSAIEVNPNYGESTYRAKSFIGGLVMIGASIPLFKASSRNKRRAASISFSNQLIPQLNNQGLVNKPGPSLRVKISL